MNKLTLEQEKLYNNITTDPVCYAIAERFIKDHKELGIPHVGHIFTKLEENISKYNLAIKPYADYITAWRHHKGFETSKSNLPEKLLLVITEVCEATEADRAGDDIGLQEELADTFIRLMDLTSAREYNMDNVIRIKMACNEFRPPKHGKRY